MEYIKLFKEDIKFSVLTKTLPTKGNLVYEYNPFRNYRLSQNMYEYQNQLYSKQELLDKFGIEMNDNKNWIGVPATESDPILRETGELVDFNTSELKIDINHPILMIPLYSYDGSVNLIINDGINIPRLINSRFSTTGKNTYEIVDRKGNNDTNIYDLGSLFDVDTSLYKRVTTIPKIEFKGVCSGGNLSIGNYHFYFRLSDADGNETDFIGESGLVSVFVGFDSYLSIHSGQKNENSYKQAIFQISNIDTAYQYVYVYYSRSTSEDQCNFVTEYVKINKKYLTNNAGICNIVITGFEEKTDITVSDINLFYNTVDAVNTSAVCLNMLFLANVHKPDIPYNELFDLSLRFLPYLHEEAYEALLTENYTFKTNKVGYIDPKYIYDKTGYWIEEIYRLGIVYILPNGTLSPVFNIRGAYQVPKYNEGSPYYTPDKFNEDTKERERIKYDESTNYIINSSTPKENIKGVVSFKSKDTLDKIYGIDIHVDDETLSKLKKHVKGYFFVRQSRIPTILTQGVTIGIDLESRTPTIPTIPEKGNLLELVDWSNTHITTENFNSVNYISEGFLSRYKFKFKEHENSFWKDFGTIVAAGAMVIASAAATVFTLGAGTPLLVGAGIAAAALIGGALIKEGIDEVVNYKKVKDGKKVLKLDKFNTKPVEGHDIVETDDSRNLTDDFIKRVIIKDPSVNKIQGIICPDYSINQSYFNQIFTGNEHLIKSINSQGINKDNDITNYFSNNGRHFYIPAYKEVDDCKQGRFNIIGVPDNTKAVGLEGLIFRSRAGEAEEAFRYEQIGTKIKDESLEINTDGDKVSLKKINSDIIRGSFGPYLAFNDKNNLFDPAETVNIYIPGYSTANIDNYFSIRMLDNSVYNSISERYDINEKLQSIGLSGESTSGKNYILFRGDCYLCLFTHRVNRNFNDPSAPYNDEIVDANSWKDNYDPDNSENNININLGDVNAVPLGMWVTFKIRSSNNLNIRTLDGSDVSEAAMSGHEKGFYPYYPMSVEGSYKIADSQVYNKGFSKSLSERWNIQALDVPHIKNWFGTRIMYSDIHINDAYKNGFRVFQGSNYRDYTREYGEIVKLVSLQSDLLVIFEHGVGLASVNERAVAAQGAGGNVYINSSNVLPENLMIISDMYGTQWPESVLKVPGKTGSSALWVYGVDTVAKKIWRTNGQSLECISDMRVQEFLNKNITLGERELTPKIGIRNVKTVYNAFKRDVLFTFYDNTYGFEEKVWNLCWNEILEKFITFYSWVPSYMENINNIPFSFNRDTSKWIAKLGTSHTESSIADGITLSNVLTNNKTKQEDNNYIAVDDFNFTFTYIDKEGKEKTKTYTVDESSRHNYIGVLSLSNRTLPNNKLFYQIEYTLERDNYLNFKSFEIVPIKVKGERGECTYDTEKLDENGNRIIKTYTNCIELPSDAMYAGESVLTYALKFKDVEGDNSNAFFEVYYQDSDGFFRTIYDGNDVSAHNVYTKENIYGVEALLTELYYRNSAGNAYADYDHHKIGPEYLTTYESQDVLWLRDLYTLEKIILEFGENNADLKIGNAYPVTTSDDKYYCYRDDNTQQIVSDKLGNEATGVEGSAPGTRMIFDSQDAYTTYLHEDINNRNYLESWEQGDMLGKWVVWSPSWKDWSVQATPTGTPFPCTTLGEIKSLIKYRVIDGKEVPYVHGIPLAWHWTVPETGIAKTEKVYYDLPIFKDITGKRKMLPKELLLNPDKIVTLLNIKANIKIVDDINTNNLSDDYYNLKAGLASGTSLIDAGYYESTIAIAPKWNLLFLSTDFWKHGQAGIIDITDDIYPTYWYGKQHPFEFEVVVVNDPSVHKIFTNLELIANKAKPESFHYEIVGEAYDFAKDKPNMYFRQEAMKALWQYNGADITYDRNFLKMQPNLLKKSADFPHKYYTRQDTINEIEDYYRTITLPYASEYSYDHLSGAEIVYYPTRLEYRIWLHSPAVNLDDLSQDDARSIIRANCLYLEDKWRININPILVCYKNENWNDPNRPKLPVMNSPIPDKAYRTILNKQGEVEIPDVLLNLGYTGADMDTYNWLDSDNIYGTSFGTALNRKETDIRDKFMKVRIRYSGEELAVIDFLNTIYRVSYG